MADINLDDLLKAKKAEAPEGDANVPVPTAAEVERTVTALSPEERAKVDKIKDAIDLQDSQTALTFGAPVIRSADHTCDSDTADDSYDLLKL